MRDEASMIARLSRIVPSRIGAWPVRGVPLGIGDDAAVLRPARAHDWVVSTDAFIEGRHFLARLHPPDVVGHKALARAVSDLAAMGATPRYFLLTLALPEQRAARWLTQFAQGMARAASLYRMHLIGGDLCRDQRVAAALTVLGEVPRGRALTRGGAHPGDALFVTGRLGGAQAGLEILLRHGWATFARTRFHWTGRHALPYPRLAIGRMLAVRRLASAAMDLSDGLSTDLARLCAASRVGAIVHAAAVPLAGHTLPGTLGLAARDSGQSQIHRALHGGEDYELLFTVPRRLASRIPSRFRGVPITRIGEITAQRAVLLEENGRKRKLRSLGWDHFARR